MTTLTRSHRRVRSRPALLPDGWVLYTLLFGYPVWWLLGISVLAWIIAAAPAVAWLWGRDRVRMPPGFGVWAMFVGWMLLSATQLSTPAELQAFSVRAAIYIAAGIHFLYAYNLPPGHTRRVIKALAFFAGFVVVAGMVAIVIPIIDFTTPFERALPRGIAAKEYVQQLVHGSVSQVHIFLGFPVNRPAAPFTFTNEWGAAVGILAPIAAFAVSRMQAGVARRVAIGIAVLALIPIVYSLNRGLWLSLAAAVAYVAVRLAIHGRARPLINIIGVSLVLGALVLTTPLGTLAGDRLDSGHSDTRRGDLVSESFETTLEAPLLGHGGPVVDVESPDRAPIGTHGQLYLLGVSHGIVGAALYIGTLGVILVRSRSGGPTSAMFWANASVFVALVQMGFYSHLPVAIHLILIIGAVALRPIDDGPRRRRRRRTLATPKW